MWNILCYHSFTLCSSCSNFLLYCTPRQCWKASLAPSEFILTSVHARFVFNMIQSECPRSSRVSRPSASFYLKKSYFLFFWGRGEKVQGEWESPWKMKGRVIRPEAGDLIFWSKKKKQYSQKHQAITWVAAVGNIKKALPHKETPTAAFASCLATLRALYRSTNRSQNTLPIILKSPTIRMIQKRGGLTIRHKL